MTTHPHTIISNPASTPQRLIFPLKPNQQFDTSFYNPAMTSGGASPEEINQVLTEIQAARQPIMAKIMSIQQCFILLIALSFFGMMGLTIFLILSRSPLAGVLSFFLGLILIGLSPLILRSKTAKLTQESKAAVQQVLDQYNSYFTLRGLRWVLPDRFPRWIELHKDYLSTPNPDQPTYTPPDMYQQPTPDYTTQGEFDTPEPQY